MNENKDNRPDGNRPDRNGPGNQGPNKNRQTILAFLICLLVTLVCLSFITEIRNGGTGEITYDKFIEMVDKDQIKEVTLQSGILTVEPKLQGSAYKKMTYRVNQMENIDAGRKGYHIQIRTAGCSDGGPFHAAQYCSSDSCDVRYADVLYETYEPGKRRHYGRGKKPRQGLCSKGNRYHL